jgi:hypothetical protein
MVEPLRPGNSADHMPPRPYQCLVYPGQRHVAGYDLATARWMTQEQQETGEGLAKVIDQCSGSDAIKEWAGARSGSGGSRSVAGVCAEQNLPTGNGGLGVDSHAAQRLLLVRTAVGHRPDQTVAKASLLRLE